MKKFLFENSSSSEELMALAVALAVKKEAEKKASSVGEGDLLGRTCCIS